MKSLTKFDFSFYVLVNIIPTVSLGIALQLLLSIYKQLILYSMKYYLHQSTLLVILLFVQLSAFAQSQKDLDIEKKIKSLVAQMTVEERKVNTK